MVVVSAKTNDDDVSDALTHGKRRSLMCIVRDSKKDNKGQRQNIEIGANCA